MTKIKICGLKNPELAKRAAMLGADYIGLIFHESSPRHVDVVTAKKIAETSRQHGATPVAVFVDQTAEEMIGVCKATLIDTVQLHGETANKESCKLPKQLKKIFVGNFCDDVCEEESVLYDDIDKITIHNPENKKLFIAGGLNRGNVNQYIQQYQPYAVDVSSGVENENGEKTEELIGGFIRAVKSRYGKFGGVYMPEMLMAAIKELAEQFELLKKDRGFQKELDDLLTNYAGRETPLTEVKNFSSVLNGPRVFLKREDLLHTGAHKINNALGQCLLAKRMGKNRIIAETGAGQHGLATATACARLGLQCDIFMGAVDIERQYSNVEKMKMLGANVIAVHEGSKTLKDAVNAALRDYAHRFINTHYCLGSALGPYPYPEMVSYFQSVIGRETKKQCPLKPDLIIACVGGGSNAIGMFSAFLEDDVELIGVEAEGAARFKNGSPGVLHGSLSYLLQDENGQVLETHSISAGLDYPSVGPHHANLFEKNRVKYASVSDEEALNAFKLLSRTEGIIPALESSHALAYFVRHAQEMDKNATVVINLSGRGDKDLARVLL